MLFFPLIKEKKGLSTLNQVERASSAKPKDKAFEKSTYMYMRTYVRVQYENYLHANPRRWNTICHPFAVYLITVRLFTPHSALL